jgi:hypothetical protein
MTHRHRSNREPREIRMTRRNATLLILAATLAGSGCVRDDRRAGGPIDVRAPGVRVQVGRDGGTTVRAPGVAVEAGPEAIEVEAPRY